MAKSKSAGQIVTADKGKSAVVKQMHSGRAINTTAPLGKIHPADTVPAGYRTDDSKLFDNFRRLKDRWLYETGHHSDPNLKLNNTNYKAIIHLGRPVLPFLFEDLFERKTDWLEAIAQILDVDPVKKEHYGNMDLMIRDWWDWRLQHKGLL